MLWRHIPSTFPCSRDSVYWSYHCLTSSVLSAGIFLYSHIRLIPTLKFQVMSASLSRINSNSVLWLRSMQKRDCEGRDGGETSVWETLLRWQGWNLCCSIRQKEIEKRNRGESIIKSSYTSGRQLMREREPRLSLLFHTNLLPPTLEKWIIKRYTDSMEAQEGHCDLISVLPTLT